jgi:hypothetical protein
LLDPSTYYLPEVAAEHLGSAPIHGLEFLALPRKVGRLHWLTDSFERLGRESRRWFDIPGHNRVH